MLTAPAVAADAHERSADDVEGKVGQMMWHSVACVGDAADAGEAAAYEVEAAGGAGDVAAQIGLDLASVDMAKRGWRWGLGALLRAIMRSWNRLASDADRLGHCDVGAEVGAGCPADDRRAGAGRAAGRTGAADYRGERPQHLAGPTFPSLDAARWTNLR